MGAIKTSLGVFTLALAGLAVGVAGAVAEEPAAPAAPGKPAQNGRPFDYWQPDWMVRELWGPGHMPKGMRVRLLRHSVYMQFGVPAEYAGATSSVKARSEADIDAGRKIYTASCASCHGADGMGSGEGGRSLSPSPALLAYMITRPVAVDEYLLWAIADGGAQFETEMPAFKDRLTREEIWRVIAFMRAGFPAAKP